MGSALRHAMRSVKNINVENRAHRVIDKEKPAAAPRHPSTVEIIKNLEQNPEIKEKIKQKDSELSDRLKQVYVTSDEKPETDQGSSSRNRGLPQNRATVEFSPYGYAEPKIIPEGKTTLQKALEFISKHQEDSLLWNAQVISDKYKVTVKDTEDVLEHFKAFEVYVPPRDVDGAGQTILRFPQNLKSAEAKPPKLLESLKMTYKNIKE